MGINKSNKYNTDDCVFACRCKWLARMYYTVIASVFMVIILVFVSACHATVGLDKDTQQTVVNVRADIKELKSELMELRKAIQDAGYSSVATRRAILDLLKKVNYGIELLGGKRK